MARSSGASPAPKWLVQIDLVDELLAGGLSVDELRRQQAEQVTAALAGRS